MLSLSVVPSLSGKLKQLKCGQCNEHDNLLWPTSAHSLHPTLWFMPLSQRLWSEVESSRSNKKTRPKQGRRSRNLCSHRPGLLEGLSGVWELDVVIFICLYADFLKELLLALGVAFKDCIRQLCGLTKTKTTPFEMGSTQHCLMDP